MEAYCATLENQGSIAKDTTVNLLYINDRWTILLGGGSGTIIPVNLELASGDAGTATTMCSFKYFVQHALTKEWWTKDGWKAEPEEEEWRLEVSPAESPHKWRRTKIGRYESADYGHAHNGADDEGKPLLALGWINEVHNLLACV